MREHPGEVRIHLDTDLGGDTDDACKPMLLGWPEAGITGITTVADPGGRRAAYVAHVERLAGRDDIPVVADVKVSATTLGRADPAMMSGIGRQALLLDDPRRVPHGII